MVPDCPAITLTSLLEITAVLFVHQALHTYLVACMVPGGSELDQGASIAALRRFNDNLRAIPADRWGGWV
jgi:hypothetical protein